MQFECDISAAHGYTSLPQRARVLSEKWFQDNCYCLSCDSDRLLRTAAERVPEYIRTEVQKYFDNKGTRGWDTDDRRIVPLAWREACVDSIAASPR